MGYSVRRVPELLIEVQDRPGVIADITALTAAQGIVLQGLAGYSLGDGRAVLFGITEHVEDVSAIVRRRGWPIRLSQALLVEGEYQLGMLNELTQRLKEAGINIIRSSAHVAAGVFHAWFTLAPEDLQAAEDALRR